MSVITNSFSNATLTDSSLDGTTTISGTANLDCTLNVGSTSVVKGLFKRHVGLALVDNTRDTDKPISTAMQTALDLKAPLASPTFTGSVRLPTGQGILKSTSTGTVSSSAVSQSDLDTGLVSRLSGIDTAIAALQAFDASFVATTDRIQDGAVTSNKLASSLILTGTPVAPTAADSTNTTQIATTAFVQTAVSNLVGSAPDLLNTLGEISSAIKGDANINDTMVGLLALKAASADVYTKTDANALLAAKADSANVYTTTAADTLLAAKAAASTVSDHAIKIGKLTPILPDDIINDDFTHVFVEATNLVYSDAQPPMALPSASVSSTMNHTSHRLLKGRGLHGNRDGWYFRNTFGSPPSGVNSGNNKINWYYQTPKNAAGVKTVSALDEIDVPLKIFMSGGPNISILPPQITVYTKPKGDGKDFDWYRTRRTYMVPPGTTLTADSKYLFRCLVNGSSLTGTFDPSFANIDLQPLRSTLATTIVAPSAITIQNPNGFIRSETAMTADSVIRPFEADEVVYGVAIGSDSSAAAGRCEFFMHNVIMLGPNEKVMYHHSNENAAAHYFSRKISDICKATAFPIREHVAL